MKNLVLFLTIMLLCSVAIDAQTLVVSPYGVSPREASLDGADIFDRAYSGLLNVGVKTKMYIKGERTDGALAGATWTIATKPTGSAAAFGSALTESNYIVKVFTPDVAGKYVINFTDEGVTASIVIHAGLYTGNVAGGCVGCHNTKYQEWQTTGHSTALTRGLNGMKGDHFGSNCVSCHSIGYDTNAANNGFDDFDFVFPDTLYNGMADSMVAKYPLAMARANIQCEACHGPGSDHFSKTEDNKIVSSLDSKTCAVCHDSGTHHVYPAQYDVSGHASGSTVGYAGGRSGCSQCHSGSGFIASLKGETEVPPAVAITCATCHDPHNNAEDNHQLRTTADVVLGDGEVVTDGGYGKLCMNCHKSRRDAKDYTSTVSYSSHYGPHHGPQADLLMGKNAPTFGVKLPSSPHGQAVENACVGCHMSPAHVDDLGNVILAGGHSFSMTFPNGDDNVAACVECHGELTSFGEKKYYFNGNADHDGDGVAEGLKEEVEGMLEELAMLLPPYDSNAVDISGTFEYSLAEATAAYNWFWVEEDRSFGVHNPAFAVGLLRVSIEALKYGAITGGTMVSVNDIPMDQGYQVRTVWTAFGADDGVAKDQVATYTVLRQVNNAKVSARYNSISEMPADIKVGDAFQLDGDIWDVVAEVNATQFMEYSAVVPTLVNAVEGDTVMSTFKVLGKTQAGIVAETAPMSGYSMDNLAPATPNGLVGQGIENRIEINWNESEDKDFKYFAIYRGEAAGFEATTPYATTTGIQYVDNSVVKDKDYFYKISAFDFNGNQSVLSQELNIKLVGVEVEEGMPTKFSLYQNYPNPFNPTTQIKFGIPEASSVKITIYNSVGKRVAELTNRNMEAGYHTITWNASNMATGVYFCELHAGSFKQVNKMLLIK